ncbi:MAG: hypothetical protein ACK452_09095 [Bacteroidota bacterium]|jgi:hypothetical protein
MKSILNYLIIATGLFYGATIKAQSQDEIIKKHIDAIGGAAAWAKVNSMKMEASMKMQGAEVKMTFLRVNKKASRQNISVMGMDGYIITTQNEGWTFMPFQGQTKPEPMTADDIKNAQDELNIQEEFISYKELGKKLEYLGKEDVDGTECYKFKMTNKDGKETSYFLDTESYYTIKQSSKVVADGKEMEAVVNFGNYKKLPEGIVCPMTIGAMWGDTEVTKIEVNPVIEDKEFKVTQ